MRDFDALRRRCEDQLKSLVAPMGREMDCRRQEWLIDESKAALAALLRRPPELRPLAAADLVVANRGPRRGHAPVLSAHPPLDSCMTDTRRLCDEAHSVLACGVVICDCSMKSSSAAMTPVPSGGTMRLSAISLALCFGLVPFAAHATVDPTQHHRALHHAQRHAIPAKATALVPAVKVDDDADGLSRNPNDCNRGCIDN
jgi:hypothetical protein